MGITNNDSNSNEPHIIKYFEVFIVLVFERKVDQKIKRSLNTSEAPTWWIIYSPSRLQDNPIFESLGDTRTYPCISW